MQLQEIEKKIADLKKFILQNNQSEIQLKANGGKSVLLVTPPENEIDFINVIKESFDEEKFKIIDINALLINFIGENREEILEKFDLLSSSIYQIFKAPAGEESNDFYDYIIKSIKQSFDDDKVPILINVGALYGTGIKNINIMEDDVVTSSNLPLIILYPGVEEKDRLMFLNSRQASKYRCMIFNEGE